MTDDRSTLATVDDDTSLVNIKPDEYASDVITVELDRPDRRNALNIELIEEIHKVCDALTATERIKGIIITNSLAAGICRR